MSVDMGIGIIIGAVIYGLMFLILTALKKF